MRALPLAASRATGSVMPGAYQRVVALMAALGTPSVCGRSPCQPDQTIVMPWASRKPLPAPLPRTTPLAALGITGFTAL